jgi:hypothetical protein
MIQRPQTVFLFIGAALLVAFAALTYTWLPGVATLGSPYSGLTVAFAVAAAVVALVAIFLYKDRKRQRTVIGWAQGLALTTVIPILAGLLVGQPEVGAVTEETAAPYLAALIPFAAYVMLRMARRGVDRDIATIRSMDRLR